MNFKRTFLIYQPCPENFSHVVFLFFFEGSVNMNKMSKNRFNQGKKKTSKFNQKFGPINVYRQNTLFSSSIRILHFNQSPFLEMKQPFCWELALLFESFN